MAKPCYLRKTELKLADGKTYSFRALPLNRRTMPILRAIVGDETNEADRLEALLTAVETSMLYDQTEEVVNEVLETGLVSVADKRIVQAMVAGIGG